VYATTHTPSPDHTDQRTQQILSKEAAWDTLDSETRQRLYALLPASVPGDMPHDPNVNPLQSRFGKAIEKELRKWQDDLKEGRETKKWREEAMLAGKDRSSGSADVVQKAGGRESGEDS
jgi:hypothetical protein